MRMGFHNLFIEEIVLTCIHFPLGYQAYCVARETPRGDEIGALSIEPSIFLHF